MKSVSLILVLTVLAIILALYSENISTYFIHSNSVPTGPSIGQITGFKGPIDARPRGEIEFVSVSPGFVITNFMTIRSGPEGHAEISLINGYVVELESDSEILFEVLGAHSKQIVTTLRRGDFKILKEGTPNTLMTISHDLVNVQTLRPLNPMIIDIKKEKPTSVPAEKTAPPQVLLPQNTPPPVAPNQLPTKIHKQKEITQSLSDTYINNVISSQSQFFYRCYAKLLQLNPSATGELRYSFMIGRNGKIQDIRLIADNIKNGDLIKCTRAVLTRIRFRPYDGPPITVAYPLVFK